MSTFELMKRILAFILLCFYTLTSTGATVYIHHCADVFFIRSSKQVDMETKSCPHCKSLTPAAPKKDSSSSCEVSKSSCCTDVPISLTKGTEKSELSVNSINQSLAIVPTSITLHWIPTSIPDFLADAATPAAADIAFLPPPISPYLLHCTFRI